MNQDMNQDLFYPTELSEVEVLKMLLRHDTNPDLIEKKSELFRMRIEKGDTPAVAANCILQYQLEILRSGKCQK